MNRYLKSIITRQIVLVVLAIVLNLSAQSPKTFVYIANRTSDFRIYELNTGTGELSLVDEVRTEGTAFTFTANRDQTILYVGLRGGALSGIMAFDRDPVTGLVAHRNTVEIPSGVLTLELDRTERFIMTAPYSTPVVTINPVAENGNPVDASEVINTDNNPHQFIVDPSNKFAYVPCLGNDNIHLYHFDETQGILNAEAPEKMPTERGSGPRLMAFHNNGNYVYLGLELNNTVSAYSIDTATGHWTEINTLSTLPQGQSDSKTAQIHISPNNQFVYIANRGHNSIAWFRVNENNGSLREGGFQPFGSTPRAMAIDPEGKYLFVGSYNAGNVVTYGIDQTTGALTELFDLPIGGNISGFKVLDGKPPVSISRQMHPATGHTIKTGMDGDHIIYELFSKGPKTLSLFGLNGSLLEEVLLPNRGLYKIPLKSGYGPVILKIQP